MPDEQRDPLLSSEAEAGRLLVGVPVTNDGPLAVDERKRIISAVEGHMLIHGLTQKDVAKGCKGIGANTLCQILNLKYNAATQDEHLRSLNNWIEQDARRRAHKPGKRPLTNTAVVRWIQASADMCRQQATMGVVMGPSGIGKSCTIEIVVKETVGAIYMLITKDNRTESALLSDLCEHLKVGKQNRRKDLIGKSNFKRVVEQFRHSHRLVVCDDADKLTDSAVELLREIHDAVHIPILLIGVVDIWHRICVRTDADHGQLKRRFGVRCNLRNVTKAPGDDEPKPLFTVDQIRAICSSPKVRLVGNAAKYLLSVALEPGGGAIGRCLQLVQLAVRRVRNRQKLGTDEIVRITVDDLDNVARRSDMSGFDVELFGARLQDTEAVARSA